MDMPVPQQQQIPDPQMPQPQQPPGMQSMGQGPMGSGLANNAMMLTKFREPYMRMATQMAMEGQEPPQFEQWVQSQMPQQQAQPQNAAPEGRRGIITRLVNSLKGI